MCTNFIDLDRRCHNTLNGLFDGRFLLSAKLFDDQPGRPDGYAPKCKIPVHSSNLRKHRNAGNTIAYRLPCTLTASQQCRISNDLPLVNRKIADDEVQEEIVELEASSQENKNGEGSTEAMRCPVVCWLRGAKLSNKDSSPEPPGALNDYNCPKCTASTSAQRNLGAIEVSAEKIAASDGNDTGEK
jgi:hypothetical protein